jgi:hypothetical protein
MSAPCVATYLSPADFLRALARRLRTTPERVPAARATEEMLSWIETCTAAGLKLEPVFLHTAFRLVYEHARLVIGPNRDQIDALAERLSAINTNRPQAAKWTRGTGANSPAWFSKTDACQWWSCSPTTRQRRTT